MSGFSPDDNFAYLQQLAEAEERIRVFRMEENGGTYLAKNFGMTQAKGDFIGFMDSDDYCHAQRIEFQVASLDKHPDVMGITHDYFRIDESSDIEFRGIGALRMACISLLIRREVIDEIGFFDSLRVGADTEYIERIEAYYGKNRRLRLRVPSMFMMLHSSSLTGGGPFHISWRSGRATDCSTTLHSEPGTGKSRRDWLDRLCREKFTIDPLRRPRR